MNAEFSNAHDNGTAERAAALASMDEGSNLI